MSRPEPARDGVASLTDSWRLDRPVLRRCRGCGVEFQASWRPQHWCQRCCDKVGSERQQRPPARYRVPAEFQRFALDPIIAAVADEPFVVLQGPTGAGKTTQAHQLLARHLDTEAHWQPAGALGFVWTEERSREAILTRPHLVLDDVARRDELSDAMVEALCLILDHRVGERLQTIITTMRPQREVDALSAALGSRMAPAKWIRLVGRDRRRGHARQR